MLVCIKARCVRDGYIKKSSLIFRSIQNTDKYTSTKYPRHLMLLARVALLPIDMYNTITIWYTTMYHETFVVINIQGPLFKRPSPSNIGLRQEDIIVIKNNIEWKNIFAFGWICSKCFTHVHSFFTSEHYRKRNTVTSEPLTDQRLTRELVDWMWCQLLSARPSHRQRQSLNILSLWTEGLSGLL